MERLRARFTAVWRHVLNITPNICLRLFFDHLSHDFVCLSDRTQRNSFRGVVARILPEESVRTAFLNESYRLPLHSWLSRHFDENNALPPHK